MVRWKLDSHCSAFTDRFFLYADFFMRIPFSCLHDKIAHYFGNQKIPTFRYKHRFVGLWNQTEKNFIYIDLKWNFNENSREFHVISCIFQRKSKHLQSNTFEILKITAYKQDQVFITFLFCPSSFSSVRHLIQFVFKIRAV